MAWLRTVLVSLVIGLVVPAGHAMAQEFAVIVNAANATDTLEQADLARIFLGRAKTFPDGSHAAPVIGSEDNQTRINFEQSVLEKSPSQMRAYWAKQMFSGQGRPPEEVGSDADVLSRVGSDPEAIGYVPAGMVDASVEVVYRF